MAKRDYETICPSCGRGPIIIRKRWKGLSKKKPYLARIERCQNCNFYLRRESK